MPSERTPLSRLEERALLQDCTSSDTRRKNAAITRLLADNRPRINRIARRFTRAGIDLEDLMQEGAIGVLVAIDKFDDTAGARLGTYAEYWIAAMIRSSAFRAGSPIFIPAPVRRRIREVERAIVEGGSPSDLGITQEQWDSLRIYGLLRYSSIDESDVEQTLEDTSTGERLEVALDLKRVLAPMDRSARETMLAIL